MSTEEREQRVRVLVWNLRMNHHLPPLWDTSREEIDGGDEVEPELEKELPSGHELVRRLMARFKK